MNTFLLLMAISAFIIATCIAYSIGASKPIAHVHFGRARKAKWTLEDSIRHVKERDSRKQPRDASGRWKRGGE